MTDFSRLLVADRGEPATPVHLVSEAGLDQFRSQLSEVGRTMLAAADFRAGKDKALFLPAADGKSFLVVVGLGKDQPGRWTLASAIPLLPEGNYRLASSCPPVALHGWLLAQHRFTRYRKADDGRGQRTLLGDPALIAAAIHEAQAAATVRDLIDTPAEDMGPAELEAEIRTLAEQVGGKLQVVRGDELLAQNFPAIHAVGRASPRNPRLVAMDWGNPSHPLVAIVGKGVCFDTGGLDLKPSSGMRLMKKDMGGAAHAIALARLLIEWRLPIRLRLVVAAVDNAVSGGALRPGDVLVTRKGLSVEVGNTDAEGRLILADALTFAAEAEPELILDFATLTGAARVALGPDLPAMFTNNDGLAAKLASSADETDDPLWRLPLWEPYHRMLRSTIADTGNVAEGGFAGSILAALFLQRFVPTETTWAHFDIYGWNPAALPGRPQGAAAMAIFAAAKAVERQFS